jgi:uncharacterized protein (DUF58 family)
VIPSGRLAAGLGLALLFTAAGGALPSLGVLALVLDGLLLLAAGIDAWRARSTPLSAERELPTLLAQGSRAPVTVRIANESDRPVELQARDGLHPALATEPMRERFELPPRSVVSWEREIVPRRRGRHAWGPLTVRCLGPWRLAWWQRELIAEQPVRVYPRVRWGGDVGRLLALSRRHQLGRSPLRMEGQGGEPYGLRQYRPGDPPRKIHWRATARHGHLVTREETWEQGTSLILLLDAGRSLASVDDDRSKLDHALATGLALLRVAVGRGDRVTVVAYSDRIERQVRVRSGRSGTREAYEALFDLEARAVESAHDLAVDAALRLEPRRATAVLCTSVTDLGAVERLRTAVESLGHRFRTLLVNLEDPQVSALAHDPPETVADAYAKVAAMEILLANRRLGRRLSRAGILTVTTRADRLALETLRTYLEMMGRGSAPGSRLPVAG